MKNSAIKLFDLSTAQGKAAEELYQSAAALPLVCPHSHVAPQLFANPEATFANPAELFVSPDHYVFRMLVSQGVPFEDLGVFPKGQPNNSDPEAVWRTFCEHFYLFDGTPSGLWIRNALSMVFGIEALPGPDNADLLYEQIDSALADPDYSPRKLFERFNIEVLCTTDSALDDLTAHRQIAQSEWGGQVRPTFRPDQLLQLDRPGWSGDVQKLGTLSNTSIDSYAKFTQALAERRAAFKASGAVAIDLGVEEPFTCELTSPEAERLFQKGLNGAATREEARLFMGYMVFEMARLSLEDELVMQLHAGSFRNHNAGVFAAYGSDRGFDIPVRTSWTRNLKPLLDAFGMDPRLRLILFTLDETTYTRELAPLAGAYPAVRLGPPWWFQDSPEGMLRYFDSVVETAGFFNLVGFNDDTRAFLSIPARHDLWRRMSAIYLAKLVMRGQISRSVARERMADLAYGLAKRGYGL